MADDYIFRRALDLGTNLPEMIVQLKKDRQLRNMDITKKKELFDEYYIFVKNSFLSEGPTEEEKRSTQNAAMEEVLERARQEMKKAMH
ncbi:hypothetical protein [Desulfosporosinus sp. FKA]|uniref:hypothetical protein n=1 Tax=Desulfosporosinus sp. FKA TaxID=1969834 RepID=UPI000B49C2F8|nr:hypothetical protein [Desulfosporosinus sp. FKA]